MKKNKKPDFDKRFDQLKKQFLSDHYYADEYGKAEEQKAEEWAEYQLLKEVWEELNTK